MGESTIIKIGQRDVMINIPWVLDEFENPIRMTFGVRSKAQSDKKRFGSKTNDFKDGFKYSQYFLTDNEEAYKSKVILGSLFVSETVTQMTPEDCSTVFVYSIDENVENDFTTNNKYWVTAVNERGHILEGDDSIVQSDSELIEFIANFRSISQKLQIVISENDQVSEGTLANIIDPDGIITLQKITADRLNTYLEESEAHLTVIYRQSPLALKKAAAGVAVAVVLGTAIFGYKYYTSTPSVDYFTSVQRNALISDIRRTASSALKSYESSKNWSDKTFTSDVVKQFNDFYLDNKMTPLDIGNVMFSIERSMPLYAVDWMMENITMKEGEFYVTYKRNPDGRGTFILLDDYIAALGKQISDYDIAPISENNNFDTRAYKITPRIRVGLTGKAEIFAQQRRSFNAYSSQREILLDELKSAADGWIKSNAKFNMMGLMDRLFFEDTSGLMRISKRHEKKVIEKQAELEVLESKGTQTLTENIEPGWVSGNWNDYIVLMQTDNLFAWSIPAYGISFPSAEDIQIKGEKANKVKKTDEPKYETAIQSYSVNISTNEGDDGNTVRTYGILDFQQLMIILNQPSIQVVGVNYFKESEQWSVDIRFYSKTKTFDQFLM